MSKVIYVMENKINGKKYVGQTNNFRLRMNGHRSDAKNKNSHSYNSPLSNAIRKYGWESFNNYIIETFEDDVDFSIVDDREKFFIDSLNTLTKNNHGYNICLGGQGCPKKSKTYEEKLEYSHLFTASEIKKIQQMLMNNIPNCEIYDSFPKLTKSFLSNINAGFNFKNDEWSYPLKKESEPYYLNFSKKEREEIKQAIKQGMKYKDISQKYEISAGMISRINNGTIWTDKQEKYPLCIKGCSRLHNLNTWVKEVQNDLMNSNLSQKKIAEKYNKSYSTIKKINSGSSHKNPNYKYPLISNRI